MHIFVCLCRLFRNDRYLNHICTTFLVIVLKQKAFPKQHAGTALVLCVYSVSECSVVTLVDYLNCRPSMVG